MAFGFPAYHQEEHDYDNCSRDDLMDAALDALAQLRWGGNDVGGWRIVGSTGLSFWSWGERITAEVRRGPTLFVRSQCAMPTQCFDWGRNRGNVRRFLDELERSLRHVRRREARRRDRDEERPASPKERRRGDDAIQE